MVFKKKKIINRVFVVPLIFFVALTISSLNIYAQHPRDNVDTAMTSQFVLAFGQITLTSCSQRHNTDADAFRCDYSTVTYHQFMRALNVLYPSLINAFLEEAKGLQVNGSKIDKDYETRFAKIAEDISNQENLLDNLTQQIITTEQRCSVLATAIEDYRVQRDFARLHYVQVNQQDVLQSLEYRVTEAALQKSLCLEEMAELTVLREGSAQMLKSLRDESASLKPLFDEHETRLQFLNSLISEKKSYLKKISQQLEFGITLNEDTFENRFLGSLLMESWNKSSEEVISEQLAIGSYKSCYKFGSDPDHVDCWAFDRPIFVFPSATEELESIAMGRDHECFLQGQEIYCTGSNDYDQLAAPLVEGVPRLIVAGRNHNCGVFGDERFLQCWGADIYGESTPRENFSEVSALALGDFHSCLITQDQVFCFGANNLGQSDVPLDLGEAQKIAAGRDFSCALSGRQIRCWGNSLSFKQFLSLYGQDEFSELFARGAYLCGIRAQDIVCAGKFTNGLSYQVPEMTHPCDVAIGDRHACALADEGVVCWGFDDGLASSRLTGPKKIQVIDFLKLEEAF